MKKALLGVLAIGLYVAAVTITHVPVRPLYDGSGPPLPYNWVKPPAGFKNTKPKPFSQDVDIGSKGTVGANLATTDGQAVMILPEGTIAKHGSDTSVRIRFVPLDPAKISPAAKPSAQGNAYSVTARYKPSGAMAEPSHPATVLLRYPASASVILRLDGGSWTRLSATNLPSTLQIYANTTKFGTFVAAGSHSTTKILWIITGALSFVAANLGLVLGLRERRRGPARRRN